MVNYKNYINNCIKKKYSNSTYFNKNLLDSFHDFRDTFLKRCLKNVVKKKKEKIDLNDIAFNFLKNSYLKKRLSILEKKKILNFYIKFNIHLRLLKKNKKKTNILTYLYLGYLVINLNNLNKFQKLNCILKIIDNLSISEKFLLDEEELKIIIFLLNFEKKCIKKF